jgi:hypothetical protein
VVTGKEITIRKVVTGKDITIRKVVTGKVEQLVFQLIIM